MLWPCITKSCIFALSLNPTPSFSTRLPTSLPKYSMPRLLWVWSCYFGIWVRLHSLYQQLQAHQGHQHTSCGRVFAKNQHVEIAWKLSLREANWGMGGPTPMWDSSQQRSPLGIQVLQLMWVRHRRLWFRNWYVSRNAGIGNFCVGFQHCVFERVPLFDESCLWFKASRYWGNRAKGREKEKGRCVWEKFWVWLWFWVFDWVSGDTC